MHRRWDGNTLRSHTLRPTQHSAPQHAFPPRNLRTGHHTSTHAGHTPCAASIASCPTLRQPQPERYQIHAVSHNLHWLTFRIHEGQQNVSRLPPYRRRFVGITNVTQDAPSSIATSPCLTSFTHIRDHGKGGTRCWALPPCWPHPVST